MTFGLETYLLTPLSRRIQTRIYKRVLFSFILKSSQCPGIWLLAIFISLCRKTLLTGLIMNIKTGMNRVVAKHPAITPANNQFSSNNVCV